MSSETLWSAHHLLKAAPQLWQGRHPVKPDDINLSHGPLQAIIVTDSPLPPVPFLAFFVPKI